MKKIALFAVALVSLCKTNAQMYVDPLGRAQVRAIYAFQNSNNETPEPVGISSQLDGLISTTACAISGQITGITTGNTSRNIIGVKGHAEGNYGMCYGLVGSIPSYNLGPLTPLSYGAAIYGTNYNTLLNLDDVYAGVFDGNVKITSNLIVNGSASGLFLSHPLPNSQALLSSERMSQDVSRQLSSLETGTFYIQQQPQEEPVLDIKTLKSLTPEQIEEYKQREHATRAAAATRIHYGLSVSQLEEVFPDLVYENKDGSKSINYVEMVPILVQAINELTAKFAALEGNETSSKRALSSATGLDSTNESVTLLSLGQNKPNPFGETTTIPLSVPEEVQSAFLYVYNLNGSKVAQVDITTRGKTSVSLSGANLSEGMYLYSLVADGKIVQTRRMIVEK